MDLLTLLDDEFKKKKDESLKNKLSEIKDSLLIELVEKDADNYYKRNKDKIYKEFPYFEYLKDFNEYRKEYERNYRKLNKNDKKTEIICDMNSFYHEYVSKIFNLIFKINKITKLPFNLDFWNKQYNKVYTLGNYYIFIKASLKELEKNLLSLLKEWIEEQIKYLIIHIENEYLIKLERIKILMSLLKDLDMETGYLWNLCKKNIMNTDTSILLKWVNFLKENKEIQKLCDILGKMKSYNKYSFQEKIIKKITYSEQIIEKNSNEEISGIAFSKNIETVLPSEISLLNDMDTEILFYQKFVEGKLMVFDYQNYTNVEKEKEIEDFETKKEKKGPIILCIDTSGSMSGEPENIAKAIAFTLVSKAITEKRKCFIINFSTSIEVMEFTENKDFSNILDFLKKSFHGGTDITPALKFALSKIQEESYKQADVLTISDFILEKIDDNTLESINIAKGNNNKFYSITIGNFFLNEEISKIFNKSWVYNSSIQNLDLLNKIAFYFDKED